MSEHPYKELERAKRRLAETRSQCNHFECTMDNTEAERRTLRKLQDDQRKAEQDVAWLTRATQRE